MKTKVKKIGRYVNRNRRDDKVMKDRFGNNFLSPEMSLNFNKDENDFYSAVIEFYGVDTSGPTYEGRVFLNNRGANGNTLLDESNGYVGSFHIFGHDGCWGDEGHCEPPIRGIYDSRLHVSSTPAYKYIDITKAIKKLINSGSHSNFTVTIVPKIARDQRMSDAKDVVRIHRIRINCYENASRQSA